MIIQFVDQNAEDKDNKVIKLGGKKKAELKMINAYLYSLPVSALDAVDADPNVLYVSPDRPVHKTLDYAQPTTAAAIALSNGFTGDGVGVALIDSGVNPYHPDLYSRIVYSESFGPKGTSDEFGHGSHVAGIIAGNGTMSAGSYFTRTFTGIAPKANIINLRVLDALGVGSDSAVITAIDRAIQLKKTYNIRVINLSLGRPVYESYQTDPLCLAVEKAWKAGIVVVVAAGNEGRNNSVGNDGYGTIASPGNDPYVITVGAMKTASSLSNL